MTGKTTLHIITGLNVGGAERSLHSLLSAGLARKYECHVVSMTGRGHYGGLLESVGVTVHDLAMQAGKPSLRGLGRLLELSRRLRPALIHGWMYHANLAALLVHRLALRRPSLIWGVRHSLDDIFADSKSTRFAIKVGRLTSGAPNAIVYNSATARLQHERAGYCVTHSRVIPNGFDTQRWQPDPIAREAVRREFGIPSGDLVVGFVGRFHAVKDLPNFYAALKPLMGRHAQLHCVVAGRDTGAENPELAAAIAALPVSRTHLLGERDDIERIIASFDFLCLSSRSEAFPNVVGEAMSCGVPCVVTNVGDAAAIVGETGLVVPTEDSRALSTALDRMASLSEVERHELGRAARVRIESSFSLSHTVQEYDDLYQSVMAN